MTRNPKNLDAIIGERGHLDRIETSATLRELLARLDSGAESRVKTFSREGLGLWRAVGVAFGGLGEAYAAVPATIRGAGCSIWFQQGGRMTPETLAGAIAALWSDNPPTFITPDGDPVLPRNASGKGLPGLGNSASSISLSSTH